MSELRVGQIIDTPNGPERVDRFEWGNPVTVAAGALSDVAHQPRSSRSPEVQPSPEGRIRSLGKFATLSAAQRIKV